MSDTDGTDDTDLLLLIPPNFFHVSDSEDEPKPSVLDSLMDKMNRLESRLSEMSRDMSAPRSARSTPQKLKNKLSLGSSRRELKFFSPPSKSNDSPNRQMLGEIDKFLSNVKTLRHKQPLKVETLTVDEPHPVVDSLNLSQVDRLLNSLENDKIESIYENKHYVDDSIDDVSRSNSDLTFQTVLEQNSQDFEEHLHDFRKHIEDLDINLHGFQSSNDFRSSNDFQSSNDFTSNYIQDFNPLSNNSRISSTKIQEYPISGDSDGTRHYVSLNSMKNSNQNRASCNTTSKKSIEVNLPEILPSVNLISLADLWGQNHNQLQLSDKELKRLLPKLEEEKCRRKHCEKLISDLQVKIVEMQQRLAVAMQVDTAKDTAILRFHDAWEKAAAKWKQMQLEGAKSNQRLLDIEKKLSVTEQAKELAVSTYQEIQARLENVEKERSICLEQITQLQIDLRLSQESFVEVDKTKKTLLERIEVLETKGNGDKKKLELQELEVIKYKTSNQKCQNELDSLQEKYKQLETQLQEKNTMISHLNEEKIKLEKCVDSSRKNETHLKNQLSNMRSESEKMKHDLKHFYQEQVESLVQDKLKEFQQQLQIAEEAMQQELKNREMVIAKTAAKQMHKLVEKHQQEIALIEAKHQQEVHLHELKFEQMQKQMQALQHKLQSFHEQRSNIAQQLHNVMESQWLEALKIINRGVQEEEVPKKSIEPETKNNESPSSSTPINLKKTTNEDVNPKMESNSNTHIQGYIKTILDKLPQSLNSSRDSSNSEFVDVATSWSQIMQPQKELERSSNSVKDQKKPPWK